MYETPGLAAVMKQDSGIFDIMDALTAPVLTHAQSWADSIPGRLIKTIPIARMKSLMMKEEFATLPETVAFIMTRTMEAPMNSDWAEIYFHVSCTVCQDYFNEDHWEQIGAHRTLSEYQERHLLMPLRRWIYERRRKVVKERMKAVEHIDAVIDPVQKEPEIYQTQLSFQF